MGVVGGLCACTIIINYSEIPYDTNFSSNLLFCSDTAGVYITHPRHSCEESILEQMIIKDN